MRYIFNTFMMLCTVVLLTGCGSRIPGTYGAEVRLIEGSQESQLPGYSLEEIRAKLLAAPEELVVKSNGRYIWYTAGTVVNEGTWRTEDDLFILRDDISRGTPIQPALRNDRLWRIEHDGALVTTSPWGAYNVEVVYRKQ